MEWLTGLAYGVGGFILVTGVIILVLGKFSATSTDGNVTAAMNYGMTQLGSTGLLGWIGAIIAIVIGVFFLQYFMGSQGKKKY